eukprot:2321013-Prymnesium_polylepis.1
MLCTIGNVIVADAAAVRASPQPCTEASTHPRLCCRTGESRHRRHARWSPLPQSPPAALVSSVRRRAYGRRPRPP